MILTVRQEGCRIVDTGFASDEKFQKLPPVKPQGSSTAFLTIQEGCDKFCTFCVVPYTRGSEFSRPMAKLLEEAQVMAEMGVREITLLGQNVNAYHGKDESGHERGLAYLLARIGEIDGVERLRFTTSHPRDMDDELIAAFKNNPKLMPYLHLPLQSGSDSILSAMNRRHTVSQYLDLVDEIRSVRPDIAISTDIIVGFPGETKEDFSRTMEVVRQVRFAQAYSFKYSPRPGTPAAETEDQVDEMLKSARLQELQELLNRQQEAFNSSCVGRTLSVLFEKPGRRPGQIVGRSPYLQPVHVEGDDALQGTIANVRISASGPNSLSGINV
jgi:tRNA-2-methylthio-N6-dimethylallyladenosine synthase